jgi:cytochrome c-type biogenesis protein
MLVALFAERARAFLRRAARLSHAVEIVAGVVLIAVGILLLTGTYTQLNSFFLKITPEWLQERL